MLAVILFLLGFAGSISLPEIAAAQSNSPVFVGAGDISFCDNDRDEATAKLLDNIAGTVFTVGDNAYPSGTHADFRDCYGPTWGRHKDRTRPTAGNHEYKTSGASGYFSYFGAAASPQQPNCTSNCKGYYSYNLGEWHIIALNSEIAMSAGSAQEKWLRADLAANPRTCTLAYWHKPRFSSGKHGSISATQPLWQALYEYGADVVLNGHDHLYERFTPQTPGGKADSVRGIRQFIVGTGGADLYSFSSVKANSQVRNNNTWGVLKLTLHPSSYEWEFVPVAGKTFRDSGSANCVGASAAPTATQTPPPVSSSEIFKDSFESGDLSAWSANRNDGGDLKVSPAAALEGYRGLQALIDDNNAIYVTDNSPAGEALYRARFSFDPNSIKMAGGNSHHIFRGFAGASTLVLRVEFRFYNGQYQLRTGLQNDGSTWKNSSWFPITNASHTIELAWQAATGAGANNGELALWIDGAQKAGLNGVDNDTRRIDTVRLGALAGIDTGTRGTYYFDAFESSR